MDLIRSGRSAEHSLHHLARIAITNCTHAGFAAYRVRGECFNGLRRSLQAQAGSMGFEGLAPRLRDDAVQGTVHMRRLAQSLTASA